MATPEASPSSPCGQSRLPEPSVIVTCSFLRPSTAPATRLAMPRTCAGSIASEPVPSRTDAVAGFSSEANSWSPGRESCTRAPPLPATWSMVLAISPSSARW